MDTARRLMIVVFFGSSAIACQSQWFGTSSLYLWNGTDAAADIQVEGRSPAQVRLAPQKTELLEKQTAGPYRVTIRVADKPERALDITLVRDSLTVVNLDGAGCLVRADLAGMYRKDKAPVIILQKYIGEEVIPIADKIYVMPEEPLPAVRPKTAFTYQRLAAVPCDIVNNDYAIERHIERMR